MKKRPTVTLFFLVVLTGLTFCGQAFATTMYQITIENLSPNVLSPAAFITHDTGFDLFDDGFTSSSAVELLAESGNASGVLTEAANSASVFDFGQADGGVLAQGQQGQLIIQADLAHPWLSFMSMMGISNDGFIGGTTGDGAISLFPGGSPLDAVFTILPPDVWDAGTEINDEALGSVGALGAGNGGFDENGVIFKPHLGILGIADIPAAKDWTGGPVARIRIAPIPEPSTIMLLGIGLIGLTGLGRRKKTL